MNKKKETTEAQEHDFDRDEALRKQQVEFIKEDIRMHKETGDPSPVDGEVEHLRRVQKEKARVNKLREQLRD